MIFDFDQNEVYSNFLKKDSKNLVWVDMEMTGLSPEKDFIIEIAVIVTDSELSHCICGPVLAIYQKDEILNDMDAWNKRTHSKTGLIERVKASSETAITAEKKLLSFLEPFVMHGKSPMCGNSVGQDRRFMERYMPRLAKFFHYRNLDVSVLKELAQRWYSDSKIDFKKKGAHIALEDIKESIEELRYYREKLFVKKERIG